MRTRLVTISIAFSALAACNLYFGDSRHDTTPPQDPDAGFFTPDGNNGGCCPPDAGSGSGSGCHTPDAGWAYPDAGSGWGWPDAGSGWGYPDAGGWPPDDGGIPDDAGSGSGSGSGYPDAGCC